MKKIFYGWWVVLACFGISFYVGGVVFFGFTAFFEPLRDEFGWSYTQISLAASLRGLEMGIFAPLVGFLVDRFGSRKLILFGTITVGFGLILLSLTRSLVMFYGFCLLVAFGAGGCTTLVLTTVVANWFHRNMGIALGAMMSGYGASGLLVPFIVGLIDVYDWRITLIILGIGMLIVGTPSSFVIRNRPEPYGYFPDGKLSNEADLDLGTQDRAIGIGLRGLFRKRSYLFLNIVEALRFMILVAVITHIMPYLSSAGVARSTAGIVAGAIPLVSILGRIGFGWLGDVWDKRYVMACTFLSTGLGMLALSYVQARWALCIFLLLFSSGFGGGATLRGSILKEYFGRDSFGKMFGIIMGSSALGGIIGPALAGWVFDTSGSYCPIWILFCALSGLSIPLILKIR
ncbi:MAG: MFS transporter [Desulfobacteraceae bacterium]